MTRHLDAAHQALRARALRTDQGLLGRLPPEPRRPTLQGYGVLPEILEDKVPASVAPVESTFSLEALTTAFSGDFRDAALLEGRANADIGLPLEPLVTDMEKLRKRVDALEVQLRYHAFYQKNVSDQRASYEGRNKDVAALREIQSLRKGGGSAERIATLQQAILVTLPRFNPTPGLALRQGPDGLRVLAVTVVTDIEDKEFLASFRKAIEEAYVTCEAARSHRFAVELVLRPLAAAALYPEGAPAHGALIDIAGHLARFPKGTPALTTGAESTHTAAGPAILLGPNPLNSRVMAHEFGHVLGFSDAYVRGYDGDPNGPYGVTLVEWTGLTDDLMGNPGIGRVTSAMIETLIAAYGER